MIGQVHLLLYYIHRLVGKRGPLFVPLKDHTGVIQLIVTNDEVSVWLYMNAVSMCIQGLMTQLNQLPTESVVSISGQVQSRPKQDRNTVSPIY